MSKRLKKHALLLKVLSKADPRLNAILLKGADKELISCLSDCALNVLNGNVRLTKTHKSKLSRYKKGLRHLAKRNTSGKKRKQILQTGGFLGALLAPIVGLLSPLIGKIFN